MIGYPFDSKVTFDESNIPTYDRAVSSKILRKLDAKLLTDGVVMDQSDALQVFPNTVESMNVIVHPGFGIIQGGKKLIEQERVLSIEASDTMYDRIDTVVLRLNDNIEVRDIDLYVLKGQAAPRPTRPELTKSDTYCEIGLADLFIVKNSTSIPAHRITDTRLETSRCGVSHAMYEFDTTTLYNQINADLDNFQKVEKADFDAWFEKMKGQLSTDAAGNLQLQIDDAEIQSGKEETLNGTVDGTLKIVSIDGKSIQNGTPTPEKEVKIENPSFSEVKSGNANILNIAYELNINRTIKRIPLKLSKGTKVKLSNISFNSDNPKVTRILIGFAKKSGGDSFCSAYLEQGGSDIITLDDSTDEIIIYGGNGYNQSIQSNTTIRGLMVTTYLSAHYTPHQESKATIPLTTLAEGDKIVEKDGVWGTYKTKGKDIFTGNENWKISNNGYWYYFIKDNAAENEYPIKSNFFATGNWTTEPKVPSIAQGNGKIPIIAISQKGFNSLDEMKQFLKSKKVEYLYELAEPTFVPFENQQQFYNLKTYDGQTNLSTNSELQPTFNTEYGKTKNSAYTLEALQGIDGLELDTKTQIDKAIEKEVIDRNEAINQSLATIKDYVIERGTWGIWNYTKYKSGYVEMWGRVKKDEVLSKVDGGYAQFDGGNSYPFKFKNRPFEVINVNTENILVSILENTVQKASMFKLFVASSNPDSTINIPNVEVTYHTFGQI